MKNVENYLKERGLKLLMRSDTSIRNAYHPDIDTASELGLVDDTH